MSRPGIVGSCTVDECKISEGNSCLEGFSENLSDCPNYRKSETVEPQAASTESDIPDDEIPQQPHVALTSGRALRIPEANALAASEPTTVVLLAGPHESGKTTLLASIFERFRSGPFVGHKFAGSETLVAFETICRLSRAASELENPDTERTKVREAELLHLSLVSSGASRRVENLLLSDISGEIFERGSNTSEDLRRIPLLDRADHVSLFFDGGCLSDQARRHACKQQGLTLLRACCEEKVLRKTCSLSVVFSRQDLIVRNKEEPQYFQQLIEDEIESRYRSYFNTAIRYVRLAARPTEVGFGPPVGVEEVLDSWIRGLVESHMSWQTMTSERSGSNQADSYLWKRLGVQ